MYYATGKIGSIKRAGMDGSNPTTLVTGLGQPWDITVDLKTSKLFWTDYYNDKIESSNLDGGERRTVISLFSFAAPTGVAVSNDRLYWGESRGRKLQSSTMDGQDVIILHTEVDYIYGVAVVTDLILPRNRTNHCARNSCSKVCVLTPTSSRCLT